MNENTTKNERFSNVELLRLLAMISIIWFHIIWHGAVKELSTEELISQFNNGYFCQPKFYWKLLIFEVLLPLGKAMNVIFILISGYFLIDSRRNKYLYVKKTIIQLVSQMAYAAGIIAIASLVYYKIKRNTGVRVVLVSSSIFNSEWWFIGYYIMVVCIGLLMHKALENRDKVVYECIMLILFAAGSLSWPGGILENIGSGLRTLPIGVFSFLLGGYIKKYNPLKRIKSIHLIAITTILYGFVFLSYYNTTKTNTQKYISSSGDTLFIQNATDYPRYSFIPLVLGIIIFTLFLRLKLPYIKCINGLSRSTFMVYLIHENSFVRQIYREIDWITILNNNLALFLLYLILFSAMIFIIGAICYLLFIVLSRLLCHFFTIHDNLKGKF